MPECLVNFVDPSDQLVRLFGSLSKLPYSFGHFFFVIYPEGLGEIISQYTPLRNWRITRNHNPIFYQRSRNLIPKIAYLQVLPSRSRPEGIENRACFIH